MGVRVLKFCRNYSYVRDIRSTLVPPPVCSCVFRPSPLAYLYITLHNYTVFIYVYLYIILYVYSYFIHLVYIYTSGQSYPTYDGTLLSRGYVLVPYVVVRYCPVGTVLPHLLVRGYLVLYVIITWVLSTMFT